MKILVLTGIVAIVSCAVSSCQKAETIKPATRANITLSSPISNHIYHKGDTIHIQGIATNETKLHGYHIAIVDENEDTVFTADDHTHATELTIIQYWVNPLTVSHELKVMVSAIINHEGESATNAVVIKVQP